MLFMARGLKSFYPRQSLRGLGGIRSGLTKSCYLPKLQYKSNKYDRHYTQTLKWRRYYKFVLWGREYYMTRKGYSDHNSGTIKWDFIVKQTFRNAVKNNKETYEYNIEKGFIEIVRELSIVPIAMILKKINNYDDYFAFDKAVNYALEYIDRYEKLYKAENLLYNLKDLQDEAFTIFMKKLEEYLKNPDKNMAELEERKKKIQIDIDHK